MVEGYNMSLQMMYITNNPEVAKIAEKYSVDRIWVDLEQIGKKERQGGMDTVQSMHSVEDVRKIRNSIVGKIFSLCNYFWFSR